jgi:hypothetical protein
MNLGIWQIVILVLMVLTLGVALGKHGQEREPYNFWLSLIATGIEFLILSWGGFFK